MATTSKSWIIVSVACLMVLAAGCKGRETTYELKLGHALSTEHPVQKAALEFAKGVEADTKGRVKISVVGGGSLGGERDMIEQVRLGGLALGILSGGAHAFVEPKVAIEELPYAFATHEQAYAAMDGDLGKKVVEVLQPHGIQVLAVMENGFRNMTNSVRPITKPADMKGLKLRTAEIPMRIDMMKMLGASPTPMAFTELFTALQQKTVDGQENPLAIIYSSKFYEVQKYLSMTNHIWGSMYLEIHKATWDSLPKDIQEALVANALKARDMERQEIVKSESELVATLKEKGMQVNEADVQAFRAAVKPLWDKYAPTYGDWMDALAKYVR